MDRYSFDRDGEASLLQDTFELGESESIVWDCRQRALQASLVALTFFALLADFLLLSCIIPIVPSVLQPRDPVTSELVDEATSIPTSLVFLLFSSKALVQMLTAPFVAAFVRRRGPLLALLLSLLVLAMSATVFGAVEKFASAQFHAYMIWFETAVKAVYAAVTSSCVIAPL